MKKIVLVYGLIAGVVVAAMIQLWMFFYREGIADHDNGLIFGYASMIIALSMVFFGIKSYRDNQNGGTIGFWKGVQVGILISLVAALVYAGAWEIYVQARPDNVNDFLDQYTEHQLNSLRESGASAEEIERAASEIASFRKMYENPLARFGVTLMEIAPVGIVVTIISAALLRKRELLPAGGHEAKAS
jgi:hypothetical protein